MNDGCKLERVALRLRKTFACADDQRIGVNLQKVVDVVEIGVGQQNHLLRGFRDGHKNASFF